MYALCTDYYDDTLATMTKATVSLPYPPALSTLDCMAGIHSELEPEVKISLTESWMVASHHPPCGAHESMVSQAKQDSRLKTQDSPDSGLR